MRGRWCRFYATPALSSMLAAEGQTGAEVKLQLHWCDRAFVVAVVKSVFHQGAFIPVPDVPTALGDEGFCASGQLVRCDRPISKIDATEVIALHEFLGVDDLFDEDRRYCLIVDNAAQLLLIQKAYNGEGLVHFRTVYQPSERSRHGDEYAFLSEKRVGIIGVGSLGSKVAVSLARAGVGRFELVDGDILHADNLERHDADWRDVGLHKADLTARRLKLVHRNVDAHTWRTAIGAQVSNSEAGNVDAALAGCDLIVDATAKADAFNHLAGLAGSANKVLVWGSMYAGGVGGEVARSRPALDPSPFDVRDAIAAFAAASEAPPPRPEGAGYDGNVEGTHWTASDADVCAIASTVSSLALDALIKREPSRFDAHGYIIGLDRAWIFSGPFHVQPIIADAPFRTDVSPPEQSDAEREFIGALMKKKLDEVTDRADGDRRLDRFAPESSS